MQDTMDGIPAGAQDALESWLGDRVGTLLHAWITDDDQTVLAVVGTVTEEAFDEETDGYDVDSIELHMLTVYDDRQGSWLVSDDSELTLGSLFGDLANRYVEQSEGI